MNEKEIKEFVLAKKNPISTCIGLSKYFIGRHKIIPIYLTPQFEKEFNNKICELEKLKNNWNELKHFIDNAIYNSKYLYNLHTICRYEDGISIKIYENIAKKIKELEENK